MSETATKSPTDNKYLGVLWQKQSPRGTFFTGVLKLKDVGLDKEIPIVVFSNSRKSKDTHPDFEILLSRPKEGNTTAAKKEAPAKPKTAPKPSSAVQEVPENDADIAF